MTQLLTIELVGVKASYLQSIHNALMQTAPREYQLGTMTDAANSFSSSRADVVIMAFPACRADLAEWPETAASVPIIALVDSEEAGLAALETGAWDFLTTDELWPGSINRVLRRINAQKRRIETHRQSASEYKTGTGDGVAGGLLNRVIAVANASLESASILKLVCRELVKIFDVPQAVALIMDEAQTTCSVVAEYSDSTAPSLLGRESPVANNAAYDYLRRYSIPLFIPHDESAPELVAARDALLCPNAGSSLFVPLIIRTQVMGAIVINAYGPREYTDDEFLLIASAGHAISQSLENSLLHQQLALHNAELERVVGERTAELRRLSERVSAILNSASDAIMLVRGNNTIETVNPAFARLFGYESDARITLTLYDLVEAPGNVELDDVVQHVLKDGLPRRLEVQARRKDGTVFDADVAVARVDQGHNQVVCSLRDITQLKEVERIKDRFVSMVSHELRTPITTIVLSAGALRQYYDRMNDEQRKQAIARADQQAQVLAELVETILDLSRLEGRRHKRATERVDVRELASAAIAEFLPIAGGKNQALTLTIGDAPIVLLGETADFVRIWRNLISNAIKYTPPNGRITVRLDRIRLPMHEERRGEPGLGYLDRVHLPADLPTGDYMLGQVTDSGHGIPIEDFDRLFMRFQRGWASQSNIPGTGLGLALVREVLNLYGGGIDVVSEIGSGSTFSFWIPIGKGNP